MKKIYIKTLLKEVFYRFSPSRKYACSICNKKIPGFIPYRNGTEGIPELPRLLGMTGSNCEQFQCPRCNSHDRERHLLMYMQSEGVFNFIKGGDVLHFAPEPYIEKAIRSHAPASYIACDLHPQSEDVLCVNMQQMAFQDSTFDILIANHVLEHVEDLDKALSEIYRVLKPGGHAILQTPFCSKLLRTWSDSGINTPTTRLLAYGQEDHARLFGQDIFKIFESTGFVPLLAFHSTSLPNIDGSYYGVNEEEPFFFFQKP